MEKKFKRLGECNRCGECCSDGRGGSPFPKNWPAAIRHRNLDEMVNKLPQAGLCGLTQIDEKTIGVKNKSGIARVDGQKFPYIWLERKGLVKSAKEGHCPFLRPDSDGKFRCGLVGTSKEFAFEGFCKPEPREVSSESEVAEWQERYPGCSYTWEEIE